MESPETGGALRRPCVAVAVVMRPERSDNAWQPRRWTLADVVPHEDGFGDAPRLPLKDERAEPRAASAPEEALPGVNPSGGAPETPAPALKDSAS